MLLWIPVIWRKVGKAEQKPVKECNPGLQYGGFLTRAGSKVRSDIIIISWFNKWCRSCPHSLAIACRSYLDPLIWMTHTISNLFHERRAHLNGTWLHPKSGPSYIITRHSNIPSSGSKYSCLQYRWFQIGESRLHFLAKAESHIHTHKRKTRHNLFGSDAAKLSFFLGGKILAER